MCGPWSKGRARLKSNSVFANLWAQRIRHAVSCGPPSERYFASLPFSAVTPRTAVVGRWPVSGSPLSTEFHQFLPPNLTLSLHQQIPLLSAITVPLWYTSAPYEGQHLVYLVVFLRKQAQNGWLDIILATACSMTFSFSTFYVQFRPTPWTIITFPFLFTLWLLFWNRN